MKKWFAVFLVCFALFLASIYIFIPQKIEINVASKIDCTQTAGYRILSDTGNWKKWWPSKSRVQNIFLNKEYYKVSEVLMNGFKINIDVEGTNMPSQLTLFSIGKDSLSAFWQCTIDAGNNPVQRFLKYREAIMIRTNIDSILNYLKKYLSTPENIYHITIKKTSIADSFLVVSKKQFSFYPTTNDAYILIGELKNFAASNGLLVEGVPLMNITPHEKTKFELMIGIAVNKQIKNTNTFFFRQMVRGNFMTTEVKGDDSAIAYAQREMDLYIEDYQKTPAAIPFQALITDRTVQKDSSKWITKLYFPVME